MKIFQSRIFAKKVKKLNQNEKLLLDKEIKNIIRNPKIGIKKKAELKDIYVHKFKINKQQYLLAYRVNIDNLELIMPGFHKNYYRDLKKYIK